MILTIAVPIFNMERWLEKNLRTYQDTRLENKVEILCFDNASEDSSKEIVRKFCQSNPRLFFLIERKDRSYGSSINQAIRLAHGKYFRVIDADDWVDTEELVKFVDAIENCDTDVVLTDYRKVSLINGATILNKASDFGVPYGIRFFDLKAPKQTLPSIHNTTYRTKILRDSKFYMQENIFFTDEEYVILPYLWVKSVIYFPYIVYQYQIANPMQSTSPLNRARYQEHREKILRRLIQEMDCMENSSIRNDTIDYCYERISRGIGDHFTTLYMYIEDRRLGAQMAQKWQSYLKGLSNQKWYLSSKRKADILRLLNFIHLPLTLYSHIKKLWRYGK